MVMNSQSHNSTPQGILSQDLFDVLIIGAGVVGCAMARRFTLEGAHVALLEKATDILDGASKANSAILHTGFDAPPGSIELACIREGYLEYQEIYKGMGLVKEDCGAHVVAWRSNEVDNLENIHAQAHENGIVDVRLISAKQLQNAEPNLSTKALAAIAVPRESIIDPWSAPYAYLAQAQKNGAEIFLSAGVSGGKFKTGIWTLTTTRGSIRAKHVINCAGLYGDLVEETVLGEASFHITPRKGQFVVFDKAASKLVNSIILPVPTSRTKGIVVFRTVFGNLAVGPTAEDQQSRSDSSTDEDAVKALIADGIAKIPQLKDMPITALYAGLRPASDLKEYRISAQTERNWISVGGIRSTGLSGALGIAQYVFKLYGKLGQKHKKLKNPLVPIANVLAERAHRDWQRKDHGEIICHCEMVSEREIKRALEGPLCAKSLGGLKRQTRVTMGRCQGFYCAARLAELTKGHFESPLSEKI